MFLGLLDPDPDPLVRGMDPRIRIHSKISWIRNTGSHNFRIRLNMRIFVDCGGVTVRAIRLDGAWREREGKGPILLFFSVNGSGHFCGMAQMLSGVDYNSSAGVWAQDKWKGELHII
jgi:hypothetical protein